MHKSLEHDLRVPTFLIKRKKCKTRKRREQQQREMSTDTKGWFVIKQKM